MQSPTSLLDMLTESKHARFFPSAVWNKAIGPKRCRRFCKVFDSANRAPPFYALWGEFSAKKTNCAKPLFGIKPPFPPATIRKKATSISPQTERFARCWNLYAAVTHWAIRRRRSNTISVRKKNFPITLRCNIIEPFFKQKICCKQKRRLMPSFFAFTQLFPTSA